MIVLFVASASLAAAVTPTAVPTIDVLIHRIGRSVTVGDRTDVELVQVVDVDREHLVGERTVARRGPDRDVAAGPVRLAVDGPGHRHDARVGVDGEASAVVVLQAVGDRIVRGIGVAGRGGYADRRADDRVLIAPHWPQRRCR